MDALFPESPHFLEQLKHLNSASQDDVVHAFLSLAKADSKQGQVVDVQSGLHEVLSIILERVAFFPMKPTIMEVRETVDCGLHQSLALSGPQPNRLSTFQAELSRLGLSSERASGLALAWASLAKAVVASRRKVQSNLVGVAAEVRRQLPEGTESLLVSLQMAEAVGAACLDSTSGRTVNLRLDPKQAFALYENLEAAQAGVDAICQ